VSDDAAPTDEQPFADGTAWTGEARRLLERAIERHGGWDAWRRFGGVSMVTAALAGLVPRLKGAGQTFRVPPRIDVWPRRGVVVLHDFPAPGRRGVFSSGQVQFFDDKTLLDARAQPRASFAGLRKYRRWSPADALYFFGYALAHYHALPFSLAAARPLGLAVAHSAGRRLTGVRVELPASLHTHCRRQTFYFDDEGLLRRHDYVADIIGWWARGAHRWDDFVEVAGLPIARHRHVVARFGRIELPLVALHAELRDVTALPAQSAGPRLRLV
jgi:hypothetical protein